MKKSVFKRHIAGFLVILTLATAMFWFTSCKKSTDGESKIISSETAVDSNGVTNKETASSDSKSAENHKKDAENPNREEISSQTEKNDDISKNDKPADASSESSNEKPRERDDEGELILA